jgi:hypothetical protein
MSESEIHRFPIFFICQDQRSTGSPFFHMSGSEIHRFPIVKKHLSESSVCVANNHSVVECAVVKNRPIQHLFHICKSENRRFFLFRCLQFKLGIREPPVPVILWAQGIGVITSSGLLPFVDNRPHTGVWRLPKFKPQYFSSRDLDRARCSGGGPVTDGRCQIHRSDSTWMKP